MEATSHDMKWSIWRQDVYGPLFEQRGKNRLPSKEVASILVQGETFSHKFMSIFGWEFVLMSQTFSDISTSAFLSSTSPHLRRYLKDITPRKTNLRTPGGMRLSIWYLQLLCASKLPIPDLRTKKRILPTCKDRGSISKTQLLF